MSGMLAVKLRRDLRASWSRMLLMAIAIAVSLIVFGGVLYAWAVTDRETAAGYAGTEPASATILLDEAVDADRMAAIVADATERPGVLEAVGRTQFSSDITVNGEASEIPLQIFAAEPDDPMSMVRFQVEDGSWPPAADEIYIGENSFDLLGVASGDTITVTTPSGETIDLRVAGSVYDPALAPAIQEQTGRAYLSTAALGASVGLDQLKIQVADAGGTTPTHDRGTAVAVAESVAQRLRSEFGLAVTEIQVPEPYAHPHQGQTNAILTAVLTGGAAALLLSAILVANMLNALFAQQIPQIGIMKAVGAGSGRIGRYYATMTLLVAAAATAAALAPAVALGRGGTRFIMGMLGIEAQNLTAPWWVYAIVVAAGLGLAPLMALVPIAKASRTTVREAIDHHGATVGAGWASAVTTRLSRFRLLDRGLLMALRNTFRRPARFALAAGLLASAGTVFVAAMSLGAGADAITAQAQEERDWDVEVRLPNPAGIDEIAAVIDGVDGVTGAEGWNQVAGAVAVSGAVPVTSTYPDQGHGRLSVVAVPPGSEMLGEPELSEGRWLEEGETGAVVLNQNARDDVPDVATGDTVDLVIGGEPTEWTVVGIVEQLKGGSAAYVSAAGFAAATGDPVAANEFRIATVGHDEASREAAAAAVKAALSGAGYPVRSADSVDRADAISAGHLGPLIAIMLGIAIVMGVVGGIGLASTMSANVLDRTREIGVMHAIGARPRAVRRVIVAEAVFLALASCAVAVIPTLILTAALGSGLGNLMMSTPLPFRISGLAVVIWLVLVVLGAVLATEAAAARASRLTVREALAYL